MKRLLLLTLAILSVVPLARAQSNPRVVNPAIDMQGYLRISAEAAKHRESRRIPIRPTVGSPTFQAHVIGALRRLESRHEFRRNEHTAANSACFVGQ